VLQRRVAWPVAIVAMLTMTVSYADRTTLAVLAPSVMSALDISPVEYGWLVSAFSIAYLVGTPLGGWWIDRVGARRGLVASLLAWSAVAALHAVVPGFGVLFALRIALGLTEGPSFPGSAQTMQRVLPPEDRPRGFGFLFSGSSIGAMLVPPIASALYSWYGWRVAFVGSALVGLAWIPAWLVLTGRPAVAAQMDAPVEEPLAGPALTIRELVSHPVMLRALCAVLAAAPIFGFVQAWGAVYLSQRFGVAQGDIGGYLWLPPLMLDAGAILFGDLASRQRRAAGITTGIAPPPRALFAIAMVLATSIALLPLAETPWNGMITAGVALAGATAMYTLATADLLSRVPARNVSLAAGVLACAQSVALIVINPLVGKVLEVEQSYTPVAIALAVWVVPSGLAWILWQPRMVALPAARVVER
jgi:ACS family hexuronate transporter-like MFS transporter